METISYNINSFNSSISKKIKDKYCGHCNHFENEDSFGIGFCEKSKSLRRCSNTCSIKFENFGNENCKNSGKK